MKFSMDAELIEKARELILHQPNLDVLKPLAEGHYAPVVQALENAFKQRDATGDLLLPDLSALANSTIGIFSDYGGESTGNYYTYSFLICAYGSIGPFREEMKKVRAEFSMGEKEIAFKSFRKDGPVLRALPAYLNLLNGYVPGLLFTMAVDKRLLSLFGPQSKDTLVTLSQMLAEKEFGTVKPHVAEKVLRVVHTSAFLTALLGHAGQKIFWMSDHDAICAHSEMHNRMLALFHNALGLYTDKQFGLIGGARPFAERSTEFLDLLSATDIAAGAVGQYFSARDAAGNGEIYVKEGAEKVLLWLGHDALGLKKLSVMISPGENGDILSGPITFTPKESPEGVTFLPTQLCR